MKIFKYLTALLSLMVIALVAWLAYIYIPLAGAFGEPDPTSYGTCRAQSGFVGAEDVAIDHETGKMFISSADWRQSDPEKKKAGGIFLVDLNDRHAEPILVSSDAPTDFQPHGIFLWKAADSQRKRLFVVNHPTSTSYSLAHNASDKQIVEIFDVRPDWTLAHAETITLPDNFSPNDVAADGPNSFFVTSDLAFHGRGGKRFLQRRLMVPLSEIAYYDGIKIHIVAGGLNYANGMNISADGQRLYVNEIIDREMSIYSTDLSQGKLKLLKRHKMGMSPDNVEVAANGKLVVAGFHDVNHFLDYQHDETIHSPALIVELDPQTGERRTLYYSKNDGYKVATVGARYQDKLIIGGLFEDHIFICEK